MGPMRLRSDNINMWFFPIIIIVVADNLTGLLYFFGYLLSFYHLLNRISIVKIKISYIASLHLYLYFLYINNLKYLINKHKIINKTK